MQFIDLKAQQARIRSKVESNILNVLDHGQYIMGPEIKELEQQLAEYAGTKHAIACSSGTDALLLALMAHGVGPGDAIITTPFTFIATAEVISLVGATPVFVDIDPKTYNICPTAIETTLKLMKKCKGVTVRGIIPVDLFGLPADYDPINAIAEEHGLFVIEDAAQGFGGEYKGKRAGSLAEIACTSFFPAKPLGGYGDGGMCFTNDDKLMELMRSISVHGQGDDRYENVRIGINGRLDSFQAAVLTAKQEIFPEEVELRNKAAAVYNELLANIDGLTLPTVPSEMKSVWAQYCVLAKSTEARSHIQATLKEAGIPTAVYYPKPLHLQGAFENLGYSHGEFPVSEDCASRIFALPMHPYLAREDQERIAEVLKSI